MQYRLVSAIAASALFANVNGLPIAQPEVGLASSTEGSLHLKLTGNRDKTTFNSVLRLPSLTGTSAVHHPTPSGLASRLRL